MYVRLRNGKFEVNKTLSRGQWGLSQDDAGRIYRNTNSSALYVDLVPTPYFTRNPTMLRTRGSYEFLGQDGNDINITWPHSPDQRRQPRLPGWCPSRGRNTVVVHRGGGADHLSRRSSARGTVRQRVRRRAVGQPGQPDHHRRRREGAAGAEGLCARRVHRVDRRAVPAGLPLLRARRHAVRGGPLSRDHSAQGLHHGVSARSDSVAEPRAADRARPRLSSRARDARSATPRPRFRKRPRQRWSRRSLTRTAGGATPRSGCWSSETTSRQYLPSGSWRSAPRISARGCTRCGPSTAWRASTRRPSLGRWPTADRDVRAAAVRVSERWLKEPGHALHAPVVRLTSDSDWAVRAQVAASLGELPVGEREAALASVLDQHATDPIAADAALSGMKGIEEAVLDRLLLSPTETPARSAAVTLVAGTIVAAAQDRPVQALFDKIADPQRPAWQRSALLRGAEVSLLGAAAPGSPAGRGRGRGVAQGAAQGDEPCPTCPGGRGGPGGAPAFPRAAAAARRRRRGEMSLRPRDAAPAGADAAGEGQVVPRSR